MQLGAGKAKNECECRAATPKRDGQFVVSSVVLTIAGDDLGDPYLGDQLLLPMRPVGTGVSLWTFLLLMFDFVDSRLGQQKLVAEIGTTQIVAGYREARQTRLRIGRHASVWRPMAFTLFFALARTELHRRGLFVHPRRHGAGDDGR